MDAPNRLQFTTYGDPAFPIAVVSAGQGGGSNLHTHDFYELVCVRDGSGINIIEGHPYPMLKGDLFLMRPEDAHSYGGSMGGSITNVLFQRHLYHDTDWQRLLDLPGLKAYLEPGRHRAPHKVALLPAEARRAEACCDRLLAELRTAERLPGALLLARDALTELLVIASRALAVTGRAPVHEQSAEGNPVAEALTILHRDFRERLSVADLAETVGLTANWFGERFKAATGLTVHDYLARLRIEAARSMLERSDEDITTIALGVGFDDPSYFARVFRRLTGLTPRAYRLRAR